MYSCLGNRISLIKFSSATAPFVLMLCVMVMSYSPTFTEIVE